MGGMAFEIGFFISVLTLVTCIAVMRAQGIRSNHRIWHFTIRDMLVAMTLISAMLGIIAYMINVPVGNANAPPFWINQWFNDIEAYRKN